MRSFLATLVVAGGCVAAAASANAATVIVAPTGATAPIVLVEGGCGPGGWRDRFGYCHPRGYAPPPRYYGCRPGWHPTPYGCRPNY